MQVNEYILSQINDPDLNVLEIGPWHGFLSDALYDKGVNIHASEILSTAYIWNRTKPIPYPCYNLSYTESLKIKQWDIVIATNVIHHLHSPLHFIEETMANSKRLIISSAIFTENVFVRNPEEWGTDSIAIVLPINVYKTFLEDHAWQITHCDITHTDFKNRTSWIIDAKK